MKFRGVVCCAVLAVAGIAGAHAQTAACKQLPELMGKTLPQLKALFSNSSLTDPSLDGFGKRFRVVASNILGIDGSLTSRSDGLSEKLKRNQKQQDRMEERLAATQKRLEKQYSMLDAKLGTLNGLSSYVTQQVAQWNKS